MPQPASRFLTRTALAAAMVIALLALPAASPAGSYLLPVCITVVTVPCPCWPAGLPVAEPLICYDAPGPQTNSFAYYSGPPPLFAQVTDFWCRANGVFRWVSPVQRSACQIQLDFSCNPPICPF